ncbi:pyruvate kinase [Candidatus Hecatella orcuttiae]|uniref:pyruvate kinase n=1 Tax=Candidatus Hecatella orcuttiae TaxID=1935119 RepID=UPI002867E02C|nr:pyruvate kinase [Candidatus Hecatella orcuttiae]
MRTKIVCTIGPASSSYKVLKQLVKAGMKLARLNFSHGTHREHGRVIELIRGISHELHTPIGIIQDLPGPRLRIGRFKEGSVRLTEGATFTLTTEMVEGDSHRVSVNYSSLPQEVKKGDKIYLADGTIRLEVVDTDEKNVACKVATGGTLHSGKGMNIPGFMVKMPPITEKDAEHLEFGLEKEVDFVAFSFIQSSKDIIAAKELIKRRKSKAGVIAKIERASAFRDIRRIIRESDGIMIARGDLGVEMDVENIPILQKQLIRDCNLHGRPVITATQMLMSMVQNPRPTRAEVSDIANAVFDGTDALMLSEETAVGNYPVEAVKVMARVAETVEKKLPYREILAQRESSAKRTPEDVISYTACRLAIGLEAAAIVVPTRSGSTAYRISRYRPPNPLLVFTADPSLQRRLLLSWGVEPYLAEEPMNSDLILREAKRILAKKGDAKRLSRIILVSGDPKSRVGTTNTIRVETVALKSS